MTDTRESQKHFPTEHEILALVQAIRYERISPGRLALPRNLYDEAALSQPMPFAGLLKPVLVSENGSGKYAILDGCKRFACMQRESIAECTCGIAPFLTPVQQGLVRLLLNRGRALSTREEFLFYSWLTAFAGFKEKNDIVRFMDIPWNRMADLDELLSSPADVCNAVLENRLHAQNAADFRLLPEKDRIYFLEIFKGLGLSLQTEREFIQWMPEIACARKSSIKDFSGFKEMETVTKDASLNAPQKIQKICSFLRSLRFPGFDSACKTWNKLVNDVNPDASNVRFIASPYFEKNRLEVRLVFSGPQQVSETLEKLRGIPETAWSGLINPQQLL
jgi:hypothetical protein